MNLEIISNGLGAPSMRMLTLAAEGSIPARVAITADTGAENDRLWSNGRRTTARQYFDEVVKPFCDHHGIKSYFVRAKDGEGHKMPALLDVVKLAGVEFQKSKSHEGLLRQKTFIPMFGSDGGRLRQSCTSRWKIAAIRQRARALGATNVRAAQGIHIDEAWRRVKGIYIGMVDGWETYYDVDRNESVIEAVQGGLFGEDTDIKGKKEPVPVKWATHYYPLVELKLTREQIQKDLDAIGMPYLISSECDFCPHKDLGRWERTSPIVLDEIAEIEAMFHPHFYFTDSRIPLKEAIAQKAQERKALPILQGHDSATFDCTDGVCGV